MTIKYEDVKIQLQLHFGTTPTEFYLTDSERVIVQGWLDDYRNELKKKIVTLYNNRVAYDHAMKGV